MREGPTRKENTHVFTYFNDWSGFNVPADVVLKCHEGITDMNDHDVFIHELAKKAIALSSYDKTYLIGTSKDNEGVIDHEIAHGLFYTRDNYRNAALENVQGMYFEMRVTLKQSLREMGYCDDVLDDEIQAYMSTGLCKKLKDDLKANEISQRRITKERAPFISLFKETS